MESTVPALLALKGAGKGREMDFSLEAPERMAALLIP